MKFKQLFLSCYAPQHIAMNLYLADDNEFFERLSIIVLDNLGNENFGVKEFINATGLNRNYLSQRIKSRKKITITQFIAEVRLYKAREFLLEGTYSASEVSDKVGFNSPSYFNKCFHDHFGYPPGDIKKRTVSLSENNIPESETAMIPQDKTDQKKMFPSKKMRLILLTGSFIVVAGIILISIFLIQGSPLFNKKSMEKSIAVLPFKNLSENQENRYFADGIVEDILDRLTKIKELRIVSRTSVEQFRESTESAPEIGKKLGVNYLLEGSVQRHEGKVRITIQLIDAKTDRHILSEKIDRNMADILDLQSNIAKLIADKLQAAISPEAKQLIEKVYTHNSEAYDFYLMGRYYWNLKTTESYDKCIEYFEKAIKADSTYALAYAGLADTYYELAYYIPTPVKNYDIAIDLAKKALQIDENLPEAYAVLGAVYSDGYWQWEESREYFEKALAIDGNNMVTLYHYSILLSIMGEFDLARKYINRALELDPYSIRLRRASSYCYYHENKPKEALQEILLVEGMVGDQSAHQHLVFTRYLNAGDTISALHYAQKIFTSNPLWNNFKTIADQVIPIYESSGLKGLYQMMYKTPPNCWYAVQVDSLDLAIHYLEQICERRHSLTIDYILDRDYLKLHNDPRFMAIVEKTHLTPYFNKRYKK